MVNVVIADVQDCRDGDGVENGIRSGNKWSGSNYSCLWGASAYGEDSNAHRSIGECSAVTPLLGEPKKNRLEDSKGKGKDERSLKRKDEGKLELKCGYEACAESQRKQKCVDSENSSCTSGSSSSLPSITPSASPSSASFSVCPSSDSLQTPDHRNKHWLLYLFSSPTISLENSGSVARDHLASERTWFAFFSMGDQVRIWESKKHQGQREGFASVSGWNANQSQSHRSDFGSTRYFTVQSSLIKGQFPVQSRFVVLGMAGLQLVLIGSVLGVVLMDF
ncbi:hypothetical protein K435DRAFT_844048 [Dendrothele bispora CBS 962.96]|uniref:Uncharacterized protein n=1 Tax=Dendrothele bispora (strain CBS 962.96) TaxID=1314807 RepID=A0A4V4HCJ6_DENBC|nr:hypothetical protein K435DRAFT_844048 [Dendrothele bispora CBS 962.96]